MSRLMSREGYFTNKSNKKWGERSNKIHDQMRKFLIDFYKAGGTVAEGILCLTMEMWRAEQNSKMYLVRRDGEYQKSLRRKRLAARRSKR
jgi:hypothetical protein